VGEWPIRPKPKRSPREGHFNLKVEGDCPGRGPGRRADRLELELIDNEKRQDHWRGDELASTGSKAK